MLYATYIAPKALKLYGINEDEYEVGKPSMYDCIHKMRTRIMTSPSFNGNRIIGAILFEDTMNREINGVPTAEFLWKEKNVVSLTFDTSKRSISFRIAFKPTLFYHYLLLQQVPFLKVDKGLEPEKDGVQLMKPIPELNSMCEAAITKGVFGTKMRSVINFANKDGIKAIVEQQFTIGKQIMAKGLIPILEPEVNIKSPEKAEAENLLRLELMENLKMLRDDQKLMFKLTLPDVDDLYEQLVSHPNVVRVVALSGGYTRAEANDLLARQHGVVASFSRGLTEGLRDDLTDAEFDAMLDTSIEEIFKASCASGVKKELHTHK
jgi:fructose-bisphosphate aldolase class I